MVKVWLVPKFFRVTNCPGSTTGDLLASTYVPWKVTFQSTGDGVGFKVGDGVGFKVGDGVGLNVGVGVCVGAGVGVAGTTHFPFVQVRPGSAHIVGAPVQA